MKTNRRNKLLRRAFSFIELQVALILLGIMMASLVPLVVVQSRQLRALQDHWEHDEGYDAEQDYWIDPLRVGADGPVYHIIPPTIQECELAYAWVRKLGAPARLRPEVKDLDGDTIRDTENLQIKPGTPAGVEVVNSVSIIDKTDEPNIVVTAQSAEASVDVIKKTISIP
ncbi:MAG TPA: hypothetical protein DD670_01825 [Planctomycetaceae bacterium]|nr:hypothetical protein [Planctomycetaceae bacterium]